MVKKIAQQLRKEEYVNQQKLAAKIEQLVLSRKKHFLKDQKRAALKQNKPIRKVTIMHPHQFPEHTSKLVFKPVSRKQDLTPMQVQRQVHDYKVALGNVQAVLAKLKEINIKNERPDDYLVQMYKSDKQMLKVRRYLAQKENRVKQKMQGKDWQSNNKRRQKAKKKVQAKKERKRAKLQAKRPKTKMMKVNGKNKVKK